MKQRLFLAIAMLMMSCSFCWAGDEAYAVLKDNVLTFYYDDQKDDRPGTKYTIVDDGNGPQWEGDTSINRAQFHSSFANARPTSTLGWFSNLTSLTRIEDFRYLNTSAVTNMGYMFNGCRNLTSLNLVSFDTQNVSVMTYMFYGCSSLTRIIVGDNWSTQKVTESKDMFGNCESLVGGNGTVYDLDKTGKEYAHIDGGSSNPGYLFARPSGYAVYYNNTLTFYNDGKMNEKEGSTYLLNLEDVERPGWFVSMSNTEKVVFDESFATARPICTYSWFEGLQYTTEIVGWENLNTSKVTCMDCMFNACYLTSLDLSHFDTKNVTSMIMMFSGCQNLTELNLSSFNTSNVTNMTQMFINCKQLEQLDLSSFDTQNVTFMTMMFSDCKELKTIYASERWSTARLTGSNGGGMFNGCFKLEGEHGTTYNMESGYFSDETSYIYARIDGGTYNPGYFTYKKPAGITTGLEALQVTSDKSQITSEEWYTMDGRKLNGKPTQKGIYIQHGKKVVIK